MKERKSAGRYTAKGNGGQNREQGNMLSAEEKAAGCLFHDMMKYLGRNGCRERGYHCPLSGCASRSPERAH